MELEKLKEITLNEAADLAGSVLEGYIHPVKLIFPKNMTIDQLSAGSFAILRIELEDVVHGEVPKELTKLTKGDSNVEFTVKGTVPQLNPANSYHFIGKLVFNEKFGYQYEIIELSSLHNLENEFEFDKFLVGCVGEKKTALLKAHFENPLKVLQDADLEALKAVPGLGEKSSIALLTKFQENFQEGVAYAKLANFGLSITQSQKLVRNFGSLDIAIDTLNSNPYKLITMVPGYGWKRADEIALNGGIDPCGEIRLSEYTKFLLREIAEDGGHSWVGLDQLHAALHSIAYALSDDVLRPMLRKWVDMDNPDGFLYYDAPTNRVGLRHLWQKEDIIAAHLIRLQHSATKIYSNEEVTDAIAEAELEVGFTYTDEQKAVIRSCLQNSVSLVRGSGGTGKSSIMRPICNLLRKNQKMFAQCSLSGKAASNLSEMTNAEGSTIHRLLGWNVETGRFHYDEYHPLRLDLVILDEISLLGIDIFLSLLQAIPSGCKLIMLGDEKQLESIGAGNLIKDIPQSGAINSQVLTKIHRQAARSGIISESWRVSAGQALCSQYAENEWRGELQDLHIITYTDSALTAPTILEEFDRLFFERHIPIQDIAIILPMKDRGASSCWAINQAIQSRINGWATPDDVTISKDNKTYTLHEGDKIIIKRNCYDARTTEGKKVAIFNGNVGFYRGKGEAPGYEHLLPVKGVKIELSQQGEVIVPMETVECIELGYAITCHSAQGSGSPYVITALNMDAYALMSREWVYTALTRAKKECTLIAQISALRKSAGISRVSVKHTWLRELLMRREEDYQTTKKLPEIPKFNMVYIMGEEDSGKLVENEEWDK